MKQKIKNSILKITKYWDRLIGDDWRSNQTDLRKKMKHTQTMCYLEVK